MKGERISREEVAGAAAFKRRNVSIGSLNLFVEAGGKPALRRAAEAAHTRILVFDGCSRAMEKELGRSVEELMKGFI